MKRFITRRAFAAVLTILAVTIVVFILARLQGDPRTLYVEEDLPQAAYEAMGRELGLDKPLIVQYGIFLGKLLQGDLGVSIHQRRDVTTIIIEKLPATAKLALGGFLFSLLMGIPLGILSAVRRGTIWDYIGRSFAILGNSLPSFWVAIMAILIFAVYLGLLPTSRAGGIDHFILPSITLGWAAAGGQVRLVRSAMLEVLDSEYIKLARAKGVSSVGIVWKHALRNALLAPLTFAGLTLAALITGSVITETVFAWPGLGNLALQSVMSSDYAILQGVMVFITVFYVLTSFGVDILYAFVDPRIRYS